MQHLKKNRLNNILKDIIHQIRNKAVIKKTARTFAVKEQRIRKSTKSELLLLMRSTLAMNAMASTYTSQELPLRCKTRPHPAGSYHTIRDQLADVRKAHQHRFFCCRSFAGTSQPSGQKAQISVQAIAEKCQKAFGKS